MKLNYNQAAKDAKERQRWGRKAPLPPGKYRLEVNDISPRTSKAGGRGRKMWDSFFLTHSNEAARDVSRWRLAQSCGVFPIDDTDQLIGCICTAKVDIEEQEGFDPHNRVKRYIVAKAKSAAPTAPAASPKAAKAAELDDEVPF